MPPADVAALPQPARATLDLGSDEPGFDGSGSFVSYDSDLSPDAAVGAYATQLIEAGFRDAGRQGSWWIFNGPNLVVWFRVGTGGPPTTLLVRVEAATAEDVGTPTRSGPGAGSTSGAAAGTSSLPKSSPKLTSTRRPDPPHAGAATATGGSGGGSTGTGTASSGTAGSGTASGGSSSGGTASGGTASGGSVTGGVTTGGATGSGDGGDRSRP